MCLEKYLSTSYTVISSLPDRSLSSMFLANWYGLAVKASLFLVLYRAFFLVFSAFRRDFSCVSTMSLNWESPGRSVGELCLYIRFSCLTSRTILYAGLPSVGLRRLPVYLVFLYSNHCFCYRVDTGGKGL